MKHSFALDFINVTEAAALAAFRWVGLGDRHAADQAAVDAMRQEFNRLPISAEIVIGEGERDEAPMLYIGERVGKDCNSLANTNKFALAVDPLEGTNLCALNLPGAISVMAFGYKDNLLRAPDTYMNKLAVGPTARSAINIMKTPTWNLFAIAEAKNCKVQELTVVVLDRHRHQELVTEIRRVGSKIRLISDGDVAAAIETCLPDGTVDVLMGVGGAPEGVIAAAAVRCLGGGMQGQLRYRNDIERYRAEKMGLHNQEYVYQAEELARGEVGFVATGVTPGELLDGIILKKDGIETHTLLIHSEPLTIRKVRTLYSHHNLLHGPNQK